MKLNRFTDHPTYSRLRRFKSSDSSRGEICMIEAVL
jgi:hypothetical protein